MDKQRDGECCQHPPSVVGHVPRCSQHQFQRPGWRLTSTGARSLGCQQHVCHHSRKKAGQKSGQNLPEEVHHGCTLLPEDAPTSPTVPQKGRALKCPGPGSGHGSGTATDAVRQKNKRKKAEPCFRERVPAFFLALRNDFWRRGRDSNSWYAINVHTISNRAPSTNSDTSPCREDLLFIGRTFGFGKQKIALCAKKIFLF